MLSKAWTKREITKHYKKKKNEKSSERSDVIDKLKENMGYVRRYIRSKGEVIMWTCHKDYIDVLKGKGYINSFVPCNERATNKYSEATCLMYILNWFVNPYIKRFFNNHDIEVNEDKIALAALLQWIWRSNIRVPDSNKIIHIYIPSMRMRKLFKEWLYDEERLYSASKDNSFTASTEYEHHDSYM